MREAYFVKQPRVVEDLLVLHPVDRERPYEVVKLVTVSPAEYDNFTADMLADRAFLSGHEGLCQAGATMKCLYVHRNGLKGGVLVVPDDGGHVRWAAYEMEIE